MEKFKKYVKINRFLLMGVIFIIISSILNPLNLLSIALMIAGLWIIIYNLISRLEKRLNIN